MKNRICKISLFSLILACAATMPGDAAVKTKNSNRSYASGYQQVNALRYQQEYANATATYATTASATANLPVMVDDENLANAILNNESSETNIADLEACSMIYPNGVFRWAAPESGVRQNQNSQCVAVVELRDANTNAVLATTTVAAGDSMKCNIDYFPESGFNMAALSNVELPADAAPTEDDVKAVMNAEQKQNAGLKIAAGALIAGVAGNLLSPKEAGAKEGKIPLGTGKTQLRNTAIGVAAGAGLMAASTYSGKIAGDTIKSTAVNAASGMIVGNMMAGASGSDSVAAVTKCTIGTSKTEYDCIVGNVSEIGEHITAEGEEFYIISSDWKDVKKCKNNEEESAPQGSFKCDPGDSLVNIFVAKKDAGEEEKSKIEKNSSSKDNLEKYSTCTTESSTCFIKDDNGTKSYYRITNADITKNRRHAYAVFAAGTLPKKAFGLKAEDIDFTKADIYYRNSDGTVGEKISEEQREKNIFTMSSRDATDGGLVDISNEARAKATIAGTAAGGALGGFSGYQGAKNEVTERLLSAQREYEDSLTNFVCMTGGRYLSQYNSYVEIPEPAKTEQ